MTHVLIHNTITNEKGNDDSNIRSVDYEHGEMTHTLDHSIVSIKEGPEQQRQEEKKWPMDDCDSSTNNIKNKNGQKVKGCSSISSSSTKTSTTDSTVISKPNPANEL